MKITSSQLRKIINEELAAELTEGDLSTKALRKLRAILDMPDLDRKSQLGLRLTDLYRLMSSGQSNPQESLGEEADRTAKGNVTQAAREKYATVGDDKFPIFDKKSAESAIDLRGHAPKADRAKIINKAAKYAPKAAKKAREEDKEKNESRKITKSQLLDLIREEAAKEMDRHSKGEELLDAIGGLKGRSQKDLRAALEKAAKEKGYEETDIDDAMGLAGYGKVHSQDKQKGLAGETYEKTASDYKKNPEWFN